MVERQGTLQRTKPFGKKIPQTRSYGAELQNQTSKTKPLEVTVLGTLFFFFKQNWSRLSETKMQQSLDRLQDSVSVFLETAARYGRVVIVTNAASGWVRQSSQLAAPRLYDCVRSHGIAVVYAREVERAEQRWDNPSRWKAAAFIQQADLLRAELANLSGPALNSRPTGAARAGAEGWLSHRPMGTAQTPGAAGAGAINVVSIGDALFERVAAHACAGVWDLVRGTAT